MSVLVFTDSGAASRAAAELIRSTVQSALDARDRAVLGLSTGATPEKVYTHLAALQRDGKLSFRKVVTYNLDEYYPIQLALGLQSGRIAPESEGGKPESPSGSVGENLQAAAAAPL